MPYSIDDSAMTLESVVNRIEETDVTPSMESMRAQARQIGAALSAAGITTLQTLRKELGSKKRLAALAARAVLPPEQLVLLRREVEGWFPRVYKLDEFDWLSVQTLQTLREMKIKDSEQLFASLQDQSTLAQLAATLPTGEPDRLQALADLSRVRWCSPTVTRMLMELGLHCAGALATQAAETLGPAIDTLNRAKGYYKGKIGQRDVQRLVNEASQFLRYCP